MRKVRFFMLTLAIVAASVAMATKQTAPCAGLPQYYKVGNNFYPAGVENVDFICEWGHYSECTWVYDSVSGYWQACKPGKIVWLK